jgi:hypothetical protein
MWLVLAAIAAAIVLSFVLSRGIVEAEPRPHDPPGSSAPLT